jgi:predicted transcriptional regulator
MARTYRTRLEVLHDFLDASRRASHKTRIIGLANLNPGYFDRYAQFCLDHRLLELSTEGYRPTDRGAEVLVAIRRVLSKTAELDDAMRSLGLALRRDPEPGALFARVSPSRPPEEWQDLLLHSVARLSIPPPGFTYRSGGTHEPVALRARSEDAGRRAAIVPSPAGPSARRHDAKAASPRLRPAAELAS